MSTPSGGPSDERVEQFLGNLLRAGVVVAACVVLAGCMLYLARHGSEPADHKVFRGEPAELREPLGIIRDALLPSGRGVIQLGLLLLVATPVARVVFSAVAFARQRDATYVLLTLFVLGVLLYSLFAGRGP